MDSEHDEFGLALVVQGRVLRAIEQAIRDHSDIPVAAIGAMRDPTDEMIWASCEYMRRQIAGNERAACPRCESGAKLKSVCADVARGHIECVTDAALAGRGAR